MSRTAKNFLSFLLVFVLTVITVMALSLATQAKEESAAAYAQAMEAQAQEKVQRSLTVSLPEEQAVSGWEAFGAFLLLLAIPCGGGCVFLFARRRGFSPEKSAGRRYAPRCDMAFRESR